MTAMNYVENVDPKLAQRMEALRNANEIRCHRANVKRDLKAGRTGLVDVLEDELCAGMTLFDVLMALPRYGRGRVRKLLGQRQISAQKTLGELTLRQQNELVEALPQFAWPSAPGLPRA